MTASSPIAGQCSPRFAKVREAFTANFSELGDVGASFAVVRNNEVVVSLWGGYADAQKTRPWAADTLTNVWSTTTGVASICFAMLVDRGLADYDEPVAKHWPEFAANGKQDVTIAQLLSHQAGLCGFEKPVVLEDFYYQERAEATLAAQAPFWAPGTQSGYHAVTIGILANGLFKRIEGRTLAAFLREEVAVPFHVLAPF